MICHFQPHADGWNRQIENESSILRYLKPHILDGFRLSRPDPAILIFGTPGR